MRPLAFVVVVAFAGGAWACGSTSAAVPSPDAGADARAFDGGVPADARADAVDNGEASTTYPAFTPPVPQIVDLGGTKLHSPRIRPVYFAGDSDATQIDDALTQWLATTFAAQTAEYGFGAATLDPIVLTETAPATATDTSVTTWLTAKLDGTHAEFGAVDPQTLANELFLVMYPATTSVTFGRGALKLCRDYDAYHDDTGSPAPFGVVARCGNLSKTIDVSEVTALNAVGNPRPSVRGGWQSYDADHQAFYYAFGDELGNPCFLSEPSAQLDGGASVGRAWSNAAMRGYHDPCLPAPSGPYFAAVPVMNDAITISVSSPKTKGVKIAAGQSKTIELQMISDGPTGGPWTVSATSVWGANDLSFAFDRTSGQNGERLHLTITANTANAALFVITSSLGGRQTKWAGAVGPS